MFRRRVITLFLLSVIGIGCTDDDSSTYTPAISSSEDIASENIASEDIASEDIVSDDITPDDIVPDDIVLLSGMNPNGPHTGEIWISDGSGTERFDLQTGKRTEVSDGLANPSRDGSVYVEYLRNYETISINCDGLDASYKAQKISVIDTRSGGVLSSFLHNTSINDRAPVRLSPDRERIALIAAEDTMDCRSNTSNSRFSVFSKDGEQLYRDSTEFNSIQVTIPIQGYDFHPDGRLVILVDNGRKNYGVQIETFAGSYEFVELFAFKAAPDEIYLLGLRVGPTGTDAVIEAVTDRGPTESGIRRRNAVAHHFLLFNGAEIGETKLFASNDIDRFNSPAFSPDGQHIMVTEGFISGTTAYTASHPDLSIINNLDLVPVSSESTTYIVPVGIKEQPMPPAQYSDNIRPVFVVNSGALNTVGFMPATGISWTPVVD